MWSWGANGASQLGDGSTTTRLVPTQVPGLTHVVAVAAGQSHSLARTRSGALWVWGDGASGKLGLGNQTSQPTPVVVPNASGAVFDAGAGHSAMLGSDGTLRAWGHNSQGQVGIGSTTAALSPTAVVGVPPGVTAMSLGGNNSVAITMDGGVWTWGAGGPPLGDGTTTNRTAPGRWSPPPPMLSLGSGTYASEQVVLVTSAVPKATLRFTTTGVDPTEADSEVPADAAVLIAASTTLKARAWVQGLTPSGVASSTYGLQFATPVIVPGAGTFTTPQLVSVTTSSAQASLRYTLDGSEPTPSSPLYNGAFAIDASTTVRARAFATGWTPSGVATALLAFNYGTLAPPTFSLPTGTYTAGEAVVLSPSRAPCMRSSAESPRSRGRERPAYSRDVLSRALTSDHQALLAEERDVLGRLQRTLAALGVDEAQQEALAQSVRRLDQLFLIVIVGEFNAGKSTFINALIGQKVLDEGATPTTRHVQILTYGPTVTRVESPGEVDVIQAPIEALRDLHLVDTPGTNAIFREHEALTSDFVPRADFVLFVTSADRPFTETERAFLAAIREWGKKIVIVINKADILETPDDLATVVQFVRHSAASLLGVDPEVFAVSARAAFRAKAAAQTSPAAESFAALERYLTTTLDQRERLRLKLLNPLGVGLRVAGQAMADQEARQTLLDEDLRALDDIGRQEAAYREDMSREFRHRLASVDNVLHQFERRGVAFFDDTLRVGRVLDLLNKGRLRDEFTRDVIQDMPRDLEREVHDIIDWMVASDLRQWQGVMTRIEARRAAHADRLVGAVDSRFDYDRARLLDTVGRAADRTIQGYDRAREAETMADSVQSAVAGAALAEVGAIGLGAVVTALATTTFADVTGIMAAGALAVVGLFVIPVRRRQAKTDMRTRIERMRTTLMASLTSQFDREVERSIARIGDAVSPYSRFVRTEQQRLATARTELAALREQLAALQLRVER